MSSTQDAKVKEQLKAEMPRPMSPAEKEAIIRSMISSMRLEGIEISREVAERAVDRALSRPIPEILD